MPRQAACSRSSSQRGSAMASSIPGIVDTSSSLDDMSTTSAEGATMSTITSNPTVTGNYSIDPTHSRIGFVARHAMVTKVRGSFNEFEGSGYFDADDPANSRLELVIKAASIDTRNADRDGHLRSNDFFAMDEYPEITFRSTSVEQT